MTQNNEKRFEKEEEDRVEEAKSGWQPQPFVSTHSPLHSRQSLVGGFREKAVVNEGCCAPMVVPTNMFE